MTRRQAFFAIMGGFHYFDNLGKPYSPLHPYTINTLIFSGEIELPSDQEIMDRAKSNLLTKVLALMQISWFIVQGITRGFNSMYITKLEILTISYIMVNFLLWLAWWGKPQNTERPIQVVREFPPVPFPAKSKDYARHLVDTMFGDQDRHVMLPNLKYVPMFYSGRPTESQVLVANSVALLIGSAFAGINCIAWSHESPLFTELVLWRLSSLAIFGLFFLGCISAFLVWSLEFMLEWNYRRSDWLVSRLLLLYGLLYGAARILSIVLAFIELRSLPSGAYETFYWVDFIPHA